MSFGAIVKADFRKGGDMPWEGLRFLMSGADNSEGYGAVGSREVRIAVVVLYEGKS